MQAAVMVALLMRAHMHGYTQGRRVGCGNTLSAMADQDCLLEMRKMLCAGCMLCSKWRVSRCLEIKAVLRVPTCSLSQMNNSDVLTMSGVSVPVGVLKCVSLALC